jgi:alpha,alpha-trehalose phosphorylase
VIRRDGAFDVRPWAVHEHELRLDQLPQTESIFALSNGHIGLRGNLDEGEPAGLPGSYLNGFHELRPLPYAEAGYGNPESSQTVVNITNAKLIRLLVDDEPFDLRYGEVRRHERTLDLRAGTLHRVVEWVSPTGRPIRVTSTRLVSFTQRAIAAICFAVEPLEGSTRVVLQSGLVANETLPQSHDDPRVAAALERPLVSEYFNHREAVGLLVHRTRQSGLRMAAGMDHILECAGSCMESSESSEDLVRYSVASDIPEGGALRLTKLIAYGWSRHRSTDALRDQVRAALEEARQTSWEGLLSEQREYLEDFWDRADVEVEGDEEIQQAVRFALFHTLQAGARAETRAIAAKGLTGSGYDGHTFWDTEMFVMPALSYTLPKAAKDALLYRHRTLAAARERARQLGLSGAAFAWRTIHGEECSGYWPAGTAAFHNAAAIADATIRYLRVTGDEQFGRAQGLELLVETARLWASLGHFDRDERFRIDGVTGPDEYSAVADNNLYTNLMAERNLRHAARLAREHPDRCRELEVREEEIKLWERAAERMTVPYDEKLGVHPQSERFTSHARWDFDAEDPDSYPLMLHHPYFELYRRQVVKQADLVLALHHRGDRFTLEEKARDFAYYEPLTVRDSSLSACTQGVVAAELGHMQLAYDYIAEAALIDLDDLQHNTRDGLHIASLAGAWIGIVCGFGGLRDHGGEIALSPRLPDGLGRLAFRLCVRDVRLQVEVSPEEVSYTVRGGELTVLHHGERQSLSPGEPLVLGIPPAPSFETPTQPKGRAPAHRE